MIYAQEKLINKGADKLTEAELLSLLLSNEQAAEKIISQFGGFKGMANQPLEKFLRFPGVGEAKIIQLAACFEIAKRVVDAVVRDLRGQIKLSE